MFNKKRLKTLSRHKMNVFPFANANTHTHKHTLIYTHNQIVGAHWNVFALSLRLRGL